MMFEEIRLIDFRKPLGTPDRMVYRWRPGEPGAGRGFYQASNGLTMDEAGSSFRLRLKLASDVEDLERNLRHTRGYYYNDFEETMIPIIALLPGGRGFLAGWTMGASMCGSLEPDVHETQVEAARAAHRTAERDAEKEQEYQREENAKRRAEEEAEEKARLEKEAEEEAKRKPDPDLYDVGRAVESYGDGDLTTLGLLEDLKWERTARNCSRIAQAMTTLGYRRTRVIRGGKGERIRIWRKP